jgi:hypothetical protein
LEFRFGTCGIADGSAPIGPFIVLTTTIAVAMTLTFLTVSLPITSRWGRRRWRWRGLDALVIVAL